MFLSEERDYVIYGDDYFQSSVDDAANLDTFIEAEDKVNELPRCERTLLVDWGSFMDGFGSTYLTVLQAAVIAQENNYTLLFSRDSNNYGKYLDYFIPPPMSCQATEEMHDIQRCRLVDLSSLPAGSLLIIPDHLQREQRV